MDMFLWSRSSKKCCLCVGGRKNQCSKGDYKINLSYSHTPLRKNIRGEKSIRIQAVSSPPQRRSHTLPPLPLLLFLISVNGLICDSSLLGESFPSPSHPHPSLPPLSSPYQPFFSPCTLHQFTTHQGARLLQYYFCCDGLGG